MSKTHISPLTSAVSLLLFILLMILPAGCKKEYINGDLDGLWRLESITVNGEEQPMQGRLYWAFSFHVVQLTDKGAPFSTGNLSFDGSTVSVDFPVADTEEAKLQLQRWGVYENPCSYTVDYLSNSRLTMSQGSVSLTLTKF